jgi:hypothetical protein
MIKTRGNVESVIMLSQHTPLLLLLILILPFILLGCKTVVNPEYDHPQEEYIVNPVSSMLEKDPVMSLLGKSFYEIKQVLGEPDEHGDSGWLGLHDYILYRYEEGFIQFCSPETIENKIAVSIILGPGQEVLGAKAGMRFPEITSILGAPDFGPEIGMDDLYYMDYFGEIINDQIPEFFISFVAVSMNSPTDHVFIKWEAFQYEEPTIFQGQDKQILGVF